MSRKILFLLLVLALSAGAMLVGCEVAVDEEPVDEEAVDEEAVDEEAVVDEKMTFKWAGVEPDTDFTSVFGKAFCEAMYEWSDGMIEIEFYSYGALGEITDVIEMTVMGVTDFTTVDYGWASGVIPELQVTALHYLFPSEGVGEIIEWILVNGETMDLLEEIFREKGVVPMGMSMMAWQYITTNKPIEKMADMRDIKFRLMDSALLFDMYGRYGVSPTAVPFSEVYGGLQMGMIEAQANPLHSIYSMAFYEVQDYITQIWAEPFLVVPMANAEVFDSLPAEAQQFARDWYKENTLGWIEWAIDNGENKKHKMLDARPEITVHYLDEEAIAEFREAVAPSHERFKEELGGPRAKEIYEVFTRDIENAKAALGIE